MDKQIQELITKAYAAFNARDMDAVLSAMHPDVEWPRALDGDYVHGRDAIRAHWTKQWSEVDPYADPIGFNERPDGTVEVAVHQVIKDLKGKPMVEGIVKHVYTVKDGLLRKMELQLG